VITRPLDLASRLRPAPRSFDAWFYVNVGLTAGFLALLGSRFVLAPGLGVDFRLPRVAGARAGAAAVSCYLSVQASGQISTADGLVEMAQLPEWLRRQARADAHPSLLVRASAGVTLAEVTAIQSAAREAGFLAVVLAAEEPGPAVAAGPGGGP
jgi:biopolymer transport protein ExbD